MDEHKTEADMTEAELTNAHAHQTRSRSESQWALVWRQFRKRKLAVISMVVILCLVTISIFAPFLANDQPIYYSGFNRFEYQEAIRNASVQMAQMAKPDSSEEANAKSLTSVRLQFSLLRIGLGDGLQDDLTTLEEQIEAAAAANDRDEIKKLRIELRRQFDGRKIAYRSQSAWPIIASLTWLDVVFMTFNIVLLLTPLWDKLMRRFISRQHSSIRGTFRLSMFMVLPFLAGAVWYLAVPERLDRTDYKLGVLSDADKQQKAKASLIYDNVVWPVVPYGLDEDNLDQQHLAPIWKQTDAERDAAKQSGIAWDKPHILGTDGIGRDILSRMLWGGRVSLSVGIVAVSIYVTIGIIVGSIAGYFRGIPDLLISRVIEIVICFPSFFLILTIVAFVGPSIFNIMLVIGLTGWTSVARLVRGEFLRLSEQEFVLAGRALGYKPLRIIFRHVLPNAMAPVLVSATFGIAGAILTESSLSFLGFGITVPKPSWGGILATGRTALLRAPWLIYFPGLAIFITITAYNLVGEALRDAADPRLRGRGH